MFICLICFMCVLFFMCTIYQDNFSPLLTQELYTFHILRPKYLDIVLFPMLLLPSWIPCLMKLGTFCQPLHLKLLWRPICLKLSPASKFSNPHSHPLPTPHNIECSLSIKSFLPYRTEATQKIEIEAYLCDLFNCGVGRMNKFNFVGSPPPQRVTRIAGTQWIGSEFDCLRSVS